MKYIKQFEGKKTEDGDTLSKRDIEIAKNEKIKIEKNPNDHDLALQKIFDPERYGRYDSLSWFKENYSIEIDGKFYIFVKVIGSETYYPSFWFEAYILVSPVHSPEHYTSKYRISSKTWRLIEKFYESQNIVAPESKYDVSNDMDNLDDTHRIAKKYNI
jgi:hypothetical protein